MASDNLWLTQSLVKSRAFQSLGRTAIIVYLEFKMRCKLAPLKAKTGRSKEWIIENNGHIVYTYSDALYNGITAPRFMRALDAYSPQSVHLFRVKPSICSTNNRPDIPTSIIQVVGA